MNEGSRKSYRKLAEVGVVWGFVREATNALIVLPTTMIMARLLSPEEFGIASVAYFFLSLGSRLTQFGFNASLMRMKDLRPAHVSSVFVANLVLGATAWAVVTALAPAMAALVRNESVKHIIPVAGLTFLLASFGTVPGTLLSRDMRYRQSATSDWLGTMTNSVVVILLAWNGHSFWSIVYGHLAADVVRSVAKLYSARWRPDLHFSMSALRELFSFGAGVYAKNLLDYMVNNVDNLIVGRLLGLSALGFYDKAFNIVTRMLGRINLAGPSVSFRIFALIHEDPERFRRAYRKVVMTVAVVGYPIFTALIVIAPDVIRLLYGPRWLPSVLPFQILCAAGMLKLWNTYASMATQAKGLIWSEVRRQMLSTVLLVVSVTLFCRWGIAGAATGVLIAAAAMSVLMIGLVCRQTGLSVRELVAPLLPAVVCALGLALLLSVLKLTLNASLRSPVPWIHLLAAAVTGALYYVTFLLFSGFTELRALVFETLEDLAPSVARRVKTLATTTKSRPAAVER